MLATDIRPKLILIGGFALIMTLMVTVMLVGLQRMEMANHKLEEVVNEHSVHASLLHTMALATRERAIFLHKLVETTDPFVQDEYIITIYSLGETFLKARGAFESMSLEEEERSLIAQQKVLANDTVRLQHQVIELSRSGETRKAMMVLDMQATPAQYKSHEILRQLEEMQVHKGLEALEQAHHDTLSTRLTLLILGLSTLIISSLIIAYIYGKFTGMTGAIRMTNRDLAEKVRVLSNTQDELRHSEAWERAIREHMLDAVMTFDSRGIIDSWNPAAQQLFGHTPGEIIGQSVLKLLPGFVSQSDGGEVNDFRFGSESMLNGMPGDIMARRKDGSRFFAEMGITRVAVDGGHRTIVILYDITASKEAEATLRRSRDELEHLVGQRTAELKKLNGRLTQMARYDSLTGLPNRQPGAVRETPQCCRGKGQTGRSVDGPAVYGSGRFQAGQRHPGSPGGRLPAPGGGVTAEKLCA